MTRKQMIKKLSNFSGKWLHASSKKLERELQLRGLLGYDDPEPGFDGYGSSADDEIELMVMLSGMVSGQQLHEDEDMARAGADYAMQAIRENAVGGVK